MRLWLAFALVVLGIAAVLTAFVLALESIKHTTEFNGDTVVALVGGVATAVGTLVGFVAGQKLGSAGKEKAEQRADLVQQRLDALVYTNGDILREAAVTHKHLFEHLHER